MIYDTPKDNYYFGDVANDGAFGEELYYFPDARERSLKALDNFARINAVLLPSAKLTTRKGEGNEKKLKRTN